MSSDRILRALENYQQAREQLNERGFIIAMLMALIAAFVASLFYRFFYERRGTGSQVHRSFPLLALSITSLFIGIQVSLPLSLGLLGALSIVRFRVPIKEPEEVGFIMLVIAASISAATMQFKFMLILYLFAFVSLLLARSNTILRILRRDGLMIITLPATPDATSRIEAILKTATARHILESAAAHAGVTTLQYLFSGLKCTTGELISRVTAEGGATSANIYLDRPGGIR